jgi:hypothetical protein
LFPGVLGQPGTTVLYGGGNVNYGAFSGLRVNTGYRLDSEGLFAIEGSYLMIGSLSQSYTAGSNAAGSPVLGRPLVSAFGNGEYLEATSFPGQFSGHTSIVTSSYFQAWELNLSALMYATERGSLTALVGFRQLGLNEGLTVADNLTPLVPNALTFLGAPVSPPSTLSDYDIFHTSNQFFGGQIGGRYNYQMGRLTLEATAKIAFGVTEELTTINGGTTLATPGSPSATLPGGVMAQPTNIGNHYTQAFSVVPEADLAISYQVTPWLQARLGYSFLYWSSVIRPGNTVDRTVNVNQVLSDPAYGLATGGLARPQFTPTQSDFWAQGINFGLQFTY